MSANHGDSRVTPCSLVDACIIRNHPDDADDRTLLAEYTASHIYVYIYIYKAAVFIVTADRTSNLRGRPSL
jgi:hypothetical protein